MPLPDTLTEPAPLAAAMTVAPEPAPMPVSSIDAVTRARLVTVGVTALLADVAARLSSAQISLVVVCDAAGAMVGVVTETILVRQLGYGEASVFTTQAGEVVARASDACRPDDSLSEVLAMMQRRGLVHLPVVDSDNKPVGVLNARDGLKALLEQGHYEESLLRNYVMGIGYQ